MDVLAPRETADVDAPERSLDPMVRRLWLLNGVIGAITLAGMAVAFELLARPQWLPRIMPWAIGGSFFAVTAMPGLLMVDAQFRNWKFRVSRDDLTVRYGVLWKTMRTIPRPRIQHVDVTSGPFDRMFGLAQVAVFTAGAMGAVVTIPGLSAYDAERLRTELLGTERGR